MKLPVLSSQTSLKGKRVLLRVDWNVPIGDAYAGEDSLKLERTFATIKNLATRGAIVIILTHLGRPKGHEEKYSTKHLVHVAKAGVAMPIHFLGEALDEKSGLLKTQHAIELAKHGEIFLLENVRFFKGEEENSPVLAKAFASLGDMFVNDAFASCHRSHASVVGITKYLPSYAGPSLVAEVSGLEQLLNKPKHPFIAVVGGVKLSTKMGVLDALLKVADKVLIGGAMAHPFFVAKKLSVGKSFIQKEDVPLAKKLLKNPKLVLPTDVVVATDLKNPTARVVPVTGIKKSDMIGDIGTETMMAWSREIKAAKTIVWNGPLGITEVPSFSHGSLVIARAIAARSKGPCFGVVGGGDTLPVMFATGMAEWVDHLSTGGGAMLEFIAGHGKLPGLTALQHSKTSPRPSLVRRGGSKIKKHL